MLAKNLPMMMVESVVSSGVGSDECIYNIVYTAIEQTQSLRSLCSVYAGSILYL